MFEDSNSGVVFNLTALKDTIVGPVPSAELGGSFFFSVCEGEMPKGKCSQKAQNDENMHVCFASEMGVSQMDFGSELEYVPTQQEGDVNFLLTFHDGQECPTSAEGKRLQTTILFRCNPSAGVGFPHFLSFSPSTCTATFSWTSQYACHTCTSSDYEEVVSACTKGIQRTEQHKIGRCNGADRILVEETECTDIAIPIGFIAGATALIIIMVIVIIVVIVKNRKITVKYSKLLADQSAEMEAMADEVGDDDDDATTMSKKFDTKQIDQDDDDSDKPRDDDEDEAKNDEDEDDEDDGQGVGHVAK